MHLNRPNIGISSHFYRLLPYLITLLVPEARDGWHYGESEKTKM